MTLNEMKWRNDAKWNEICLHTKVHKQKKSWLENHIDA